MRGVVDDHRVAVDVPVEVDLTSEERSFLVEGLGQWGGSAYLTEELATAMGFGSSAEFNVERTRLARQVGRAEPLTGKDWSRVLVSTEIMFASDVFGAGVEWSIVTAFDDQTSIALLRSVQRKLVTHTVRFGTLPAPR